MKRLLSRRKKKDKEVLPAVQGPQVDMDRRTPIEVVMAAASSENVDPEKLKGVADFVIRMQDNEQRKAFAADFAAFQNELPIIQPLDQGNKNHYAKLDRIHRETRPIKKKYGMSIIWSETTLSEDGKMCLLRGMLVHTGGYTMPVSYDCPVPDPIKSKEGKIVTTVTQSMGSATSYARRYGENAVFGIVTGKDDDGAGAGPTINEKQANLLTDMLREKGKSIEPILEIAGCSSIEMIPADRFDRIMRVLERSK